SLRSTSSKLASPRLPATASTQRATASPSRPGRVLPRMIAILIMSASGRENCLRRSHSDCCQAAEKQRRTASLPAVAVAEQDFVAVSPQAVGMPGAIVGLLVPPQLEPHDVMRAPPDGGAGRPQRTARWQRGISD